MRLLAENGIETYESCEGGEEHAFHQPTIRFYGGMHDGMRALGLAIECGLPVGALHRVWDVINGEPVGPNWELVFWRKTDG